MIRPFTIKGDGTREGSAVSYNFDDVSTDLRRLQEVRFSCIAGDHNGPVIGPVNEIVMSSRLVKVDLEITVLCGEPYNKTFNLHIRSFEDGSHYTSVTDLETGEDLKRVVSISVNINQESPFAEIKFGPLKKDASPAPTMHGKIIGGKYNVE